MDRFSQMRPYFLYEEIEKARKHSLKPFKKSRASLINLIRHKNMYICPYFNTKENGCAIYKIRPFDCRLYPFLLSHKDGGVFLCADLNCPFINKNIKNKSLKDYTFYLKKIFSNEKLINKILKNKALIGTYADDVVFLARLKRLSKKLHAHKEKP
jgi:Fe-S-cluster containining protein